MDRITARADGPLTPDALVDGCLDEVGALAVSDATRSALLEFASTESADAPREKVAQMLQPRGGHTRVPALVDAGGCRR